MIGFKAFDENLSCRGFQYEIGKTYEIEEEPVVGERGFHFCKTLADCYEHYDMGSRICYVEALGSIDTNNSTNTLCTNKIRILEEITDKSVKRGNAKSCNNGYYNSGRSNDGHGNTGNWNKGDWNVGDKNVGCCNVGIKNTGDNNVGNRNEGWGNTGHYNTGYKNVGACNVGHDNVGACNLGHWNTGNYNAGNDNTGSCNIGNGNTGDYNKGNWNVGDWNKGNYSTGIFCTNPNPKIKFFDEESDWTISDWFNSGVKKILDRCPASKTDFVDECEMTTEEKEKHPMYHEIGGYLKIIEVTDADRQKWWNELADDEKCLIVNLPNFDKEKFFKCTGIEVKQERRNK